MIHSFSASNILSIRERVVMDLRIPRTAPNLSRFRRSQARPSTRGPSVVVLIGPNGSGKTALLRALVTTARIAAFQPNPVEGSSPIRLLTPLSSAKTRDKPTELSVDLEQDWLAPGQTRHLFRYGLRVQHDPQDFRNKRILHEVLSYTPKGRHRRLFERRGPDDPIYASRDFGVTPNDRRLQAVRPYASVISTLAQLNVLPAMRIADHFHHIAGTANVLPLGEHQIPTQTVAAMFERDSGLRTWVNERIQGSDLGISGIEVSGITGWTNRSTCISNPVERNSSSTFCLDCMRRSSEAFLASSTRLTAIFI